MKKFTEELWSSLSKQLDLLENREDETAGFSGEAMKLSQRTLYELKLYVYGYSFKSEEEEIAFNRYMAPPFSAEYIFHFRICRFQRRIRIPGNARKKIMDRENKELNHFFKINAEFFRYYSSGETYLDRHYFIRGIQQLELPFSEEYNTIIDQQFITAHSYKIAQFLAYEKLLDYFRKMKDQDNTSPSVSRESALHWTETGMSLTEMAYALKYAGAVNKGRADVKEIAEALGSAFNIKPVNVYRNKQDLYSRKNQGMFLDRLRRELVRGLEESDG